MIGNSSIKKDKEVYKTAIHEYQKESKEGPQIS